MTVKFQKNEAMHDSGACMSGLNILAHAQLIELEIGSSCGGHGVCGGDRVQIAGSQADLSPITADEREHLTPEEIKAGWRLACQCWPQREGLELKFHLGSV